MYKSRVAGIQCDAYIAGLSEIEVIMCLHIIDYKFNGSYLLDLNLCIVGSLLFRTCS